MSYKIRKAAAAALALIISFSGVAEIKAESDAEAVCDWLYASYSFGEDVGDDTAMGGMKLYRGSDTAYAVTPSAENGYCPYRNDSAVHDGVTVRLYKGGRYCAAAAKNYCAARPEGRRNISGNMYFDAGPQFGTEDRELTVEVVYYDEGTAPFDVRYVNGESGFGTVRVARTGSNEWKRVKLALKDAYFNKNGSTLLADGTYDFRIEALGNEIAVAKVSLYNGGDSVSGRSYMSVSPGGMTTARTYFTQGMWTADSKKILVLLPDGWVYAYDINTMESRKIFKQREPATGIFNADFFVSHNNKVYYSDTAAKTVNRVDLDTYETEVLTPWPAGAYGLGSIHVNNNDTKLSCQFTERGSSLDRETDENGSSVYRARRIPVYDIVSGEWDLRYTHEFPAGTPHMTHLMLNPVYDDLVFFCHEGTTTKVPDRLWMIDLSTGEQKNMFVQQSSTSTAQNIKTGETSGHESWCDDGEHMVFVKYPYATNVGMNGIVRIDKYGEHREYINGDYRYWHCHSEKSNRFVVADTLLDGAADGTNVSMKFGSSNIVLIDMKTYKSTLLAKIKAGQTHPYQPHPAFSPDGKLVAFACCTEDEQLRMGIMDISDLTADKPGEVFRHNTNEDSGILVSEPVLARDGAGITLRRVNARGGDTVLAGAEYDGGRLVRAEAAAVQPEAGKTEEYFFEGAQKLFLWNGVYKPLSMTPSAPERLRASKITCSGIVLQWQEPADLIADGATYEIRRNGQLIGTNTDRYYKDTDIALNEEYTYSVRAVYPNGTQSPEARLDVRAPSGEGYALLDGSDECAGLTFYDNPNNPVSDSYTEQTQIGERYCRLSTSQTVDGKTKTGKFYFAVSGNVVTRADRNVRFTVTYYDKGTAPLYIEYNASDGSVAKRVKLADRTNTNEWLTKSVSVTDAEFVHPAALTYCDFRIEGGAGTYIYRAEVKNETEGGGDVLQQAGYTAGTPEICNGLRISGDKGDGTHSVTDMNGSACAYAAPGKFLYFDVDNRYIYGSEPGGVVIEAEYYDGEAGNIYIEYSTNEPAYEANTGGMAAYKKTLLASCTGSGGWKKARILLVDTLFCDSQNYVSDFRLSCGAGLYVRSAKVTVGN